MLRGPRSCRNVADSVGSQALRPYSQETSLKGHAVQYRLDVGNADVEFGHTERSCSELQNLFPPLAVLVFGYCPAFV